jgi:hypothetical protein
VFAKHPTFRGYVLGDQRALRRHVAICLNREMVSIGRASSGANVSEEGKPARQGLKWFR